MLTSPEIQPALRWLLLGLLCLAGWMWFRRRFGLSSLLFLIAQSGALLFWIVQLHSPIGLDRTPATQEFWARIAVAHETGDPRSAYVAGNRGEATLLTRLAAGGLNAGTMETFFAFAPIALVLAFSFTGFCVAGSWPRRCLTAALASTSAPLWGLAVDLPAEALVRPSAALIAAFTIGLLAAATWAAPRARRPAWLALVTLVGLVAGDVLSRGVPGSRASLLQWLFLASVPLAALFLVPLTRTAAQALGRTRSRRGALEALLLVSVGASSSWFWWEPARTVPGFDEARSLTRAIDAPMDWIRTSAPKGATIASSPGYSALISAKSGRRALMPTVPDPSLTQPYRREKLLASLQRDQPDASLAESFGVTHLFLGPGESDPASPAKAREGSEPASRLQLRQVFRDANDFRIYELIPREVR
jgi:hypothetical protein